MMIHVELDEVAGDDPQTYINLDILMGVSVWKDGSITLVYEVGDNIRLYDEPSVDRVLKALGLREEPF